MLKNNDPVFHADIKAAHEKTIALVDKLNKHGLNARIGTLSEDLNGIDIIVNNHKIDIKFRNCICPGDYVIEIIANDNNDNKGWARDNHDTDYILYLFSDNHYAMFKYEDIKRIAEDRFNYYFKPKSCNFYLIKSRCPYPINRFITTQNNITYQTHCYCATESEIGESVPLIALRMSLENS